jgi:hypothetical protein
MSKFYAGKLFAKHKEKFAGQGYLEGPCQSPETHPAYEHTNPLCASSKIKFQNNFLKVPFWLIPI